MDDHAERNAPRAAAGHLLGQHHRHPEVRASSSELGRVLHPQEAELAQLTEQAAGNLAPLLPVVDVWDDLFFHETADRRAE